MKFFEAFLCFLLVIEGTRGQKSSADKDGKIVGGSPAAEGQFPFQLSLQTTSHFCGASIFNQRTAITAAHCCEYGYPLYLVAGEVNFDISSGHEQKLEIKEIRKHPDYATKIIELDDGRFLDYPVNDICLLITKTDIDLSGRYATGVTINKGGKCNINSKCTVSGWGHMQSGDSQGPRSLRYANIDILRDEDCANYNSAFEASNMICAGKLSGGVDSCQGDSGGPLVCNDNLCGVVSFGIDCGLSDFPGVYTKIETFSKWIEENAVYGSSLASRTGEFSISVMLVVLFISKWIA